MTIKPKAKRKGRPRTYSHELVVKITDMIHAGDSFKEVAEKVGLSRQIVYQLFRHRGSEVK